MRWPNTVVSPTPVQPSYAASLQQVQKEAAEKVAAAQRESQQQAVSSRQRTEAQVRDAQRLVRLEMEKELEPLEGHALFCLPPTNCLRLFCQKIAEAAWFDNFIILLIVILTWQRCPS